MLCHLLLQHVRSETIKYGTEFAIQHQHHRTWGMTFCALSSSEDVKEYGYLQF